MKMIQTVINCPQCDLPIKDDDYVIVQYFGRPIVMVTPNSSHECDWEVIKAKLNIGI